MPRERTVKLRYIDHGTNGISVGTGDKYAIAYYKLNNAYDIDGQIGNSSMPGYNEWAQFYSRYLVTWVSMSVEFMNQTEFACYAGVVFRPVTDETTWNTWKDWRDVEAQGFPCRLVMLNSRQSAGSKKRLTVKCPLWKVLGDKKQYYSDLTFSAHTNANPTALIQGFAVVMCPTDLVPPSPIKVFCNIKITAYVKFYNRKLLRSSAFSTPDDTVPDVFPPNPLGDTIAAGDITV